MLNSSRPPALTVSWRMVMHENRQASAGIVRNSTPREPICPPPRLAGLAPASWNLPDEGGPFFVAVHRSGVSQDRRG